MQSKRRDWHVDCRRRVDQVNGTVCDDIPADGEMRTPFAAFTLSEPAGLATCAFFIAAPTSLLLRAANELSTARVLNCDDFSVSACRAVENAGFGQLFSTASEVDCFQSSLRVTASHTTSNEPLRARLLREVRRDRARFAPLFAGSRCINPDEEWYCWQ